MPCKKPCCVNFEKCGHWSKEKGCTIEGTCQDACHTCSNYILVDYHNLYIELRNECLFQFYQHKDDPDYIISLIKHKIAAQTEEIKRTLEAK